MSEAIATCPHCGSTDVRMGFPRYTFPDGTLNRTFFEGKCHDCKNNLEIYKYTDRSDNLVKITVRIDHPCASYNGKPNKSGLGGMIFTKWKRD